jgi:AraC family transcriptional regulator
MPERLEMVVGGQRRTAMPSNPDLARPSSPGSGFLIEGHRLSAVELPDHWIPFYLVGLQTVGETLTRSYFEDGRQRDCPIRDGECVVTAPREVRRFRQAGSGAVTMVSIEPAVFQEMISGSSGRNPVELIRTWDGQDAALRNLVLRLQSEANAGYPNGTLFAESICTKLAEELIQRYSIGRVRLDQFRGGLSGVQLRRVMEYIDERLGLSLTGDEIASAGGLSKYHLGKAFKQSTGVTLHGYVVARRMKRAQELLAKSELPLAGIAAAAGFSSQSHLTALFSTRLGITPRGYREMRRGVSVSFSADGRAKAASAEGL